MITLNISEKSLNQQDIINISGHLRRNTLKKLNLDSNQIGDGWSNNFSRSFKR